MRHDILQKQERENICLFSLRASSFQMELLLSFNFSKLHFLRISVRIISHRNADIYPRALFRLEIGTVSVPRLSPSFESKNGDVIEFAFSMTRCRRRAGDFAVARARVNSL